jgi:hypothetical protein
MANTMTIGPVKQGKSQFQGMYKEMWTATVTTAFDTGITAAAEATFTVTIPGLALGDHVVSYGFNADPEENIFFVNCAVSAANTLAISMTNASGSTDTPGWTQMKFVIGRPSW